MDKEFYKDEGLQKRYEEDLKAQEERRKARKEEVKTNVHKYMAMSGIRKRYLVSDLNKVKLPEKIIKTAIEFIEEKHQGLFLTGTVGSGKTYLACAIAKEVILKGDMVRFMSAPEIFQRIRATFNGQKDTEKEIIDTMCKIDCLILDDLGAEKVSDFTVDRLYLIIDYRYGEMKKTIITSNLDLTEIKNKIHDRLASRICEMCKRVVMPDKDFRLE